MMAENNLNSSTKLNTLFNNLNSLKEALNIQANKNTKIEPVVITSNTHRPLPIPPLDPARKDGDK